MLKKLQYFTLISQTSVNTRNVDNDLGVLHLFSTLFKSNQDNDSDYERLCAINPCPAEPGYSLLCKQCRSRSVGTSEEAN